MTNHVLLTTVLSKSYDVGARWIDFCAVFEPSSPIKPRKTIMKGCIFNIDNGYLEGLCRGFKCGILKHADYLNLVQCETLEGKLKCPLLFDICI